MSAPNDTLLIVEDEWISREILVENLTEAGYEVVSAEDGETALQLLNEHPTRFVGVLLDRILPGIDGMQVLRQMKENEALAYIPVIMQTSLAEPEEVLEGLQAGAHYYLTKPFAAESLLAIVQTAVRDYHHHIDLQREADQAAHTLQHLRRAEFVFRSPEEARNIATLLANASPDAQRVVLGLSELMLNAVEHGNLGIAYDEKSRLIADGKLRDEIRSRLASSQYGGRYATVLFERDSDHVRFRIIDQGKGFDWQQYLEISPERAFHTHGRGIAMSRMISFDEVEYCGAGNEVLCRLNNTPA